MTNQITLEVAKIAMTALETVLRKTSPGSEEYPMLVEQYISAVHAYRQALGDAGAAMGSQTGTAA